MRTDNYLRFARLASASKTASGLIGDLQTEQLRVDVVDADLVRLYTHSGRPLGFIPRFRQRLQIKRAQFPLPPEALVSDDSDALSKIKHLARFEKALRGLFF